jgi:acetyl-CoA acetyltransferase
LFEAYITGIGETETGRNLLRDPIDLATDAACRAIADAGLVREQIDGLVSFVPDSGCAHSLEVQDAMGLELDWFAQCDIGPSQLSAIFEAVSAVQSGRARHVLAFHSSNEGSHKKLLGKGNTLPGTSDGIPKRISGYQQWSMAFGGLSVGHMIAMYARHHMHKYGTTREQIAQIALVERSNAVLNPNSIYRNPMTMEDYFNARMITEPLCLYDCDVPIDFGTAVIISRSDTVDEVRRTPLRVAAMSASCKSRSSWDQFDDLSTMMLRDAGIGLWERTDYRPTDVDLAMLYDGFSFIAMAWIEALGFCNRGDSGNFIEGGGRISIGGELPINTNGGQLSAGRKRGWGLLPEACLQLWNGAGDRQIPNDPRVAVIGAGGGIFGGAMLVARD